MMERVVTLATVQIGAGLDPPMVDHIVHAYVPQIT